MFPIDTRIYYKNSCIPNLSLPKLSSRLPSGSQLLYCNKTFAIPLEIKDEKVFSDLVSALPARFFTKTSKIRPCFPQHSLLNSTTRFPSMVSVATIHTMYLTEVPASKFITVVIAENM